MENLHFNNLNEEENLSDKKKKILDFLIKNNINEKWEIYIDPFFNGSRVDFVLLNETVGIHFIKLYDQEDLYSQNIKSHLIQIKERIFNDYCPFLKINHGKYALGAIGFSIAMFGKDLNVSEKINNWALNYKHSQGIISDEVIENNDILKAIPLQKRSSLSSNFMKPEYAEHFRSWLRISDFKIEEEEFLPLDRRQKELAQVRFEKKSMKGTEDGFRRIKGPAGSGKTVVLAAKSAHLSLKGKQVLCLTFNITLVNYIKSLFRRALKSHDDFKYKRNKVQSPKIEHFHGLAKELFYSIGKEEEWKAFFVGEKFDKKVNTLGGQDAAVNEICRITVADALLALLKQGYFKNIKYDAVLVDEGQDFSPAWWEIITSFLKRNGEEEAYFISDDTQDIYGVSKSWVGKMEGAGFRGPWNELHTSYRIPQDFIPKIKNFIDFFLLDDEATNVPLPEVDLMSKVNKTHFKWVQLKRDDENDGFCVQEILNVLPQIKNFSYPSLIFLSNSQKEGLKVKKLLQEKGIKVQTAFKREEKLAFSLIEDPVKISTIHSFKGMETPVLVIQLKENEAKDKKNIKLLYTALTRIRKGLNTDSIITVICSDPVFEKYGETWKAN